jgi:hypothetical protein
MLLGFLIVSKESFYESIISNLNTQVKVMAQQVNADRPNGVVKITEVLDYQIQRK